MVVAESIFAFEEHSKRSIVASIEDGIRLYRENTSANGNVNLDDLPWRVRSTIINNVIEKVSNGRLECFQIKMPPVNTLIIYDRETKFVYTILKEQNFNRQRNAKDGHQHYTRILATTNVTVHPDFLVNEIEFNDDILVRIEKKVSDKIQGYGVITYDHQRDSLFSVYVYLVDINLTVSVSENWSSLIEPDYPTDGPIPPTLPPTPTPPDSGISPVLQLRDNVNERGKNKAEGENRE